MATRWQFRHCPVFFGILGLISCAALLVGPVACGTKQTHTNQHSARLSAFSATTRTSRLPCKPRWCACTSREGHSGRRSDRCRAFRRPCLLPEAQPTNGAVRRAALRAGGAAGNADSGGGRTNSDNPLALLQQMGKLVLGLESQTEQIDYTKKNFVHADLSPEQIAEAVHKRGENGLSLFLGIAADLIRQQNLQEELKKQKTPAKEDSEPDILSLLLDPDGPVKLKRMLAQQLADFASPGAGLGHTLGTILIQDRNQAVMKVFQTELAKGKKKIGIFYGVGHLPDFDKRLRADFSLKRANVQWLTAWDLRIKNTGLEDILNLFGK